MIELKIFHNDFPEGMNTVCVHTKTDSITVTPLKVTTKAAVLSEGA